MSTLLRTGGSTSKLIFGSHPTIPPSPVHLLAQSAKNIQDDKQIFETTDSLQAKVSRLTNGGPFGATLLHKKGINVTSRRFTHTDVEFPDFDAYRRDSTRDPTKPARDSEDERRGVQNLLFYGIGGTLSIYLGKEAVQTLVLYKWMSKEQQAQAATEINLNEVPEGLNKTFEWRGKPIFVRHRTQKEIDRERAVDVSQLRDPQHDSVRAQRPEWLVLIGVCTHLGCVPIAGQGDFGGYFCPCHGSHYDAAGRIRKGPAPRNLDLPPYSFKGDDVVVVGSD